MAMWELALLFPPLARFFIGLLLVVGIVTSEACGSTRPARLKTTLSLCGRGLPMESQVLRPITQTLPVVCALKNFRSAE